MRYPDYPNDKNFEIKRPGTYILDADQIQGRLFGGGHTGPYGVLLDVGCGNVTVNLRGHTLGSDFGSSGIVLSASRNRQNAVKQVGGYGEASLDNRFVSVRQGTVDLARGKRTGAAINFADRWGAPSEQTGPRGRCGRFVELCPPLGVDYKRNDYLFEDLKVFANAVAVSAEGSHTVIRNCVIESAGNAAIFIAGPNVTIENCDIRLRALVEGDGAYGKPTRAAIVVRDGSNAVIRNNRIRVSYGGWESETHCILVRDGAENVLVEGNTFINVKGDPVTLADGSQATVRDNKSERTLWPR